MPLLDDSCPRAGTDVEVADDGLYTDETRTLYFDNISWYNVDDGQTDGYEVVAP